MKKQELIKAMAAAGEISQNEAKAALDSLITVVTQTLAKGEKIELVGFGGFEVRERSARTGRNPKTGEPIQISASKSPAFRPGKALKEAVNQ